MCPMKSLKKTKKENKNVVVDYEQTLNYARSNV